MLTSISGQGNVPSHLSSGIYDEKKLSLDQVTQTVDSLKIRLGIAEPVTLRETSYAYHIASAGLEGFLRDKMVITVNLAFLSSLSKGEREFVLLHELAHLKNKDNRADFLTALAMVPPFFASSVILLRMTSSTSATMQVAGVGICWLATRVARSVLHQLNERRADKEAFMACSYEGKRGAISFFNKQLESERTLSWARRVLTHSRTFIFRGIEHPPLSTRIRLLEALS
jgi:Zn-dependent protease with chaperone function